MSGIVCPIRGGPSSIATIERAIALAGETGQSLHFLYVVNLDFLTRTATSRVSVITEQMRQLGEAILAGAQAQAQARGIEAQAAIRHGGVAGQIAGLCHELGAQYVVLGQPSPDGRQNVFNRARLARFVAALERETGATAILSEGGSP